MTAESRLAEAERERDALLKYRDAVCRSLNPHRRGDDVWSLGRDLFDPEVARTAIEKIRSQRDALRAEIEALRGVLRKLRCPKCGDEPGEDGGLWVDDGTPSNIVRCRSCGWRVSPNEVEALRLNAKLACNDRVELEALREALKRITSFSSIDGPSEAARVARSALDAARAAETDDGK